MHGDPTNLYPGVAGFEQERGSRAGLGYNLNLAMAHGTSEADFFTQLELAFTAIREFGAQVVVHCLGRYL